MYLDLSINHVFGDHSKCEPYFCKKDKSSDVNKLHLVKNSNIFEKIVAALGRLVLNSKSLIYDVDSNSGNTMILISYLLSINAL